MPAHLLEEAIVDLTRAVDRYGRYELRSPEDAAIYDQLQKGLRTISLSQKRASAAEAYIRNGATRHVVGLFADAGDKLTWNRKVVPFPGRSDSEAA